MKVFTHPIPPIPFARLEFEGCPILSQKQCELSISANIYQSDDQSDHGRDMKNWSLRHARHPKNRTGWAWSSERAYG